MSLSCTVSEILPLLQCTWLPVTLKCPPVSIRQLKLQATFALRVRLRMTSLFFREIWKHLCFYCVFAFAVCFVDWLDNAWLYSWSILRWWRGLPTDTETVRNACFGRWQRWRSLKSSWRLDGVDSVSSARDALICMSHHTTVNGRWRYRQDALDTFNPYRQQIFIGKHR